MTPEQYALLSAPLEKKHVKSRSQSGRSLSYIEGWHAIAEANRIFGFDQWHRETLEIKCVAEHERPIGRDGARGWGVSYIAKVRVTVEGVVRDGIGAGHGIDRDLGLAHESAIKEAETDAMKRALMTFGNPFGLALYDKKQENVVDSDNGEPQPIRYDQDTPKKSSHAIKKDTPELWGTIVRNFREAKSYAQLKEIAGSEYVQDATKDWPMSWIDALRDEFSTCATALREMA